MFNRKGFTLVEVLIAMSVFSLAMLLSANILTDTVKFQRKASIQNRVFSDVNFVLDVLRKEIGSKSIDYEEYYSKYVLQENPDVAYGGINYGIYGSRFHNPGGDVTQTNPDNLGALCAVANGDDCESYITESFDFSEGKNPYYAVGAYDGTAFCEQGRGVCPADLRAPAEVEDLFLISNDGREKTLISKRVVRVDGEEIDYALGKVVMEGEDLDQNGVIDTFSCSDEYVCEVGEGVNDVMRRFPFVDGAVPEVRLANFSDLSEVFDPATSQFVPITPLAINVEEVVFRVTPLDDPYKAFSEKEMQINPVVEINMTVSLSSRLEKDYPGDFPSFTVRTIVNSGGDRLIPSYPPVADNLSVQGAEVPSWIASPDVLPAVLHQ